MGNAIGWTIVVVVAVILGSAFMGHPVAPGLVGR